MARSRTRGRPKYNALSITLPGLRLTKTINTLTKLAAQLVKMRDMCESVLQTCRTQTQVHKKSDGVVEHVGGDHVTVT